MDRPRKFRKRREKLVKLIKDHPLLTQEEEKALGERIQAGDESAVNILVEHNMKLLYHIAKGFVTNQMSLGDAISIGSIGLINAARRYDPSRENKFATYATWYIRDQLLENRYEQRSPIIHVPKHIDEIERKTWRGEELTEAEQVQLDNANRARGPHADVYELPESSDPSATEGLEGLSDDLLELLRSNLDRLTEKDASILKARYGLAPYPRRLTLMEIAKVEGISQCRVRQLERRAIERLRALILEGRGF